ncbi:MAG: macro domain-containing protein [Alphaproteobacteria bacterium]
MTGPRIEIINGDITRCQVDAIVNAANERLSDGSGVNGAIQRAAGPQLLLECRAIGGCKTGHAVVTAAYQLPAKFVFHAVGPIWQGGGANEDSLLGGCYRACFALAAHHGVRSIAFPAISTGIYGFPPARAAIIAATQTRAYLEAGGGLERIVFIAFGVEAQTVLQYAFADICDAG